MIATMVKPIFVVGTIWAAATFPPVILMQVSNSEWQQHLMDDAVIRDRQNGVLQRLDKIDGSRDAMGKELIRYEIRVARLEDHEATALWIMATSITIFGTFSTFFLRRTSTKLREVHAALEMIKIAQGVSAGGVPTHGHKRVESHHGTG